MVSSFSLLPKPETPTEWHDDIEGRIRGSVLECWARFLALSLTSWVVLLDVPAPFLLCENVDRNRSTLRWWVES